MTGLLFFLPKQSLPYVSVCFYFCLFFFWILLTGMFSNEIALLEPDSTNYITGAQMQYGIASVWSAEISGFDSKVFFKFITLMTWPVKTINALH